ncbi:acetate--CoA ligase [candidate division WOR-3 bacterium JGI_Cruoil_03_51_56]|uniref:Acetate--CoA ligase n=1 Tax=candidate division WOR-3 bacterium JGI_Cruoil_03_51_56 TaxID=1973747 RepID=A0A235BYH5_UNCW3|nr:MAG: acetate--CoA ligase [candidate division WOR-3 bacterium JGI_Cruoil_03_51_56]
MAQEKLYEPPEELVENSNIKVFMDKHGITDYNTLLKRAEDQSWYWGEVAKELDWFKPWDKVLDDSNAPFFKWFTGGRFNIAHNCLDCHMKTPVKDKIAYIFESESGAVERWTYEQLYKEVNRLANALKKLGIAKGDRVAIYLPMIPQLPVAMLACAKIGAVHSVVFSGFSSASLQDRVQDAEAKMLITCDGAFRRGKVIPLKQNVDAALNESPSIQHCIVYNRADQKVNMKPNRDLWWHDITKEESDEFTPVELDAEDILYTLYTSGTTGKPKGIVHVHAGYGVGVYSTLKYVFDIKPDDVYWCAADIGWVTGHSYIVYAPLMLGATSILYEGAPDYPAPDRFWQIIEREKVTILYTSPTAIRMFMRLGEDYPNKHDLSSLRLLGSVGEPINPEAWRWYRKYIGGGKLQIMDTWWQTETGTFMISPLPITPLKPGSATRPLPGILADVYDIKGKPVKPGENGFAVLLKPWPAMLRTIYKNPDRYKQTYWSRFPGVYLTGDYCTKDEDGYFWFRGRADEVLNVAGHRLGTAEIESALVAHPAVAEAAVIGVPHEIKGDVPRAFVTLKVGFEKTEGLKAELRKWVGTEIGPIARPDSIEFRDKLPKTRSGKIMRRLLKAEALGQPLGDTSTLEE